MGMSKATQKPSDLDWVARNFRGYLFIRGYNILHKMNIFTKCKGINIIHS
jgi:hypothetical protein